MISDILGRTAWRLFLEGDAGGGAGGGAPADAQAPDTTVATEPSNDAAAESELSVPGYFSQLPEAKSKSEAYKALYRYQRLDDLADALIKAQGDIANLNSDRAIVIPEKGDTEGIAEFKKKLGVPETPEGYAMEALSEYAESQPELITAIRKGCQRMMLTEKQGNAVAEMIAHVSKASAMKMAMNVQENIRTQKDKVAALYKDSYTADIDRQKAAEEDIARYESFLKETGLEETLGKSLLAGNPELIRAISAYAKKHGGTSTQKGTAMGSGSKPSAKSAMSESQAWKDFKSQRRA